jgi:DNA-binding transcriptional LysR family regulator
VRDAPYPGDLLEHLRGLVALGRRLEAEPRAAFEAAAFGLHLDPSVLRRRIQGLSAWLGVPLVEGRGRRMRLSGEGEAAFRQALQVLAAVDQLREAVRGEPAALRIGCTGTVTNELLPGALQRVREDHPRMAIQLRRAGSRLGRRLLESGEIDLAVVRGEEAPEGFEHRRLVRDALWLALPAGHRLAGRARISPRDLAGEPLVSFAPGSFTRRRVMSVLEPLGASVQIEVEGRAAALRYVAMGLGVAFLSLVPGHRVEASGLVLREVTRHFRTAYFWALWRRGRRLRPVEQQLLRALERAGVVRSGPGGEPR